MQEVPCKCFLEDAAIVKYLKAFDDTAAGVINGSYEIL
jgi:hypothetical protein